MSLLLEPSGDQLSPAQREKRDEERNVPVRHSAPYDAVVPAVHATNQPQVQLNSHFGLLLLSRKKKKKKAAFIFPQFRIKDSKNTFV